ncbi:MAG: response regulator [Limisphaerales bacterium]
MELLRISTVLLLEDEPTDAFFFERAIRKHAPNVRLHVAADGLDGLAYIQKQGKYSEGNYSNPDLVVVDLKMPRMGGLEFLRWVREHPQHRVIPTLVLTSSVLEMDIQTAYELGVSTFFVKPNDPEEFSAMLKLIFDYWRMARIPPAIL